MPSNLTKFAKKLRKNSTKAETVLWKNLRSRQLKIIKFRRQQPIDNNIVDFVSFEKRIIIELDGGQHTENRLSDNERYKIFKKDGYAVLRFWNNEVLDNLDGVLEKIRQTCLS